MEDKKKTLEKMRKEMTQLQYEIEKEEKEKIRKEKAQKYFDKNFGLTMISDNYNIYPQEQYTNIMGQFIQNYSDGKEYDTNNQYTLNEFRKDYIENLKSDIKSLSDILEHIEEEFKELEEK